MNPQWFDQWTVDMIRSKCWVSTPPPKALLLWLDPRLNPNLNPSFTLYFNVENIVRELDKDWKNAKTEMSTLVQKELQSAQLVSRL